MTILVLTDDYDIGADLVIRELNKHGAPVARLNPWAPQTQSAVQISSRGHGVTGTIGQVRLAEVEAVWWRRPQPFIPLPADPPFAQWCRDEHQATLYAALMTVDARWLNHPHANAACTKPAQLVAAAQAGLAIPDTLITNDPEAARRFAASGRTITKALSGAPKYVSDSELMPLAFTREARPEEIDEGVTVTGHTFQRRISGAFDVRLTVVGRRQFYAFTPTTTLDWRSAHPKATFEPLHDDAVPQAVRQAVDELMDYFGLTYGAFDFSMDGHDGSWTFYELNTAGEFGFVEFATELPISAAICDELLGTGMLRPSRNPLHRRSDARTTRLLKEATV